MRPTSSLFKISAIAIAILPLSALSAPILEETVVTAQKRTESLQDVPISISAMSGEKIEDDGITDLEELTAYIPNVNINKGAAQPNLYIRGVGSGTNAGFEQSVGMYIDGVYSGRSALARVPFTLDLQRVEVIKGPQGILFGKNTIGGAINITTNKPSFENEGMVEALYSDDHNEQIYTTMLNGELTDKIAGRLAVRYGGMDGWWDNRLLQTQGPNTDNWYGRGSLLFDASSKMEVLVKYEYGDFLEKDGPAVIYRSDQPINIFGDNVYPILSDGDEGAIDFPTNTDVRTDVGAVTVNWDVDFATFTSITAYSAYDQTLKSSPGFSATPGVHRITDEKFEQYSQELRLVSPGGETIDWIAGAYFEYAELDTRNRFTALDLPQLGPLITPPLVLVPGVTFQPGTFEQESEAMGIFGQVTYSLTDTVRVTGGLRYNDETKKVDKRLPADIGDVGARVGPDFIVLTDPTNGQIISDLRSHEFTGLKQDQQKWTWSVNTQWDATEYAMLYASVGTGFKSGGFDSAYSGPGETIRLSDNPLTAEPNGQVVPGNDASILTYGDETVLAYALGAKMTLLEGAAELNVALFRSEYDDLQTSALVGDVFRVGNAGSAISQGVELDGRWAVTERLTFGGSMAYLDATYDDFKNAPCTIPQLSDPVNNPGCLNPDGSMISPGTTGAQDLTDETMLFAPKWSANLNAQYIYPFENGLELMTSVDMNYSDEYYSAQDLDPNALHGDEVVWNARIALVGGNGKWSVAILGKNLTDEETSAWNNTVPATDSNTYFAVPQRPRSVALQGRYRF